MTASTPDAASVARRAQALALLHAMKPYCKRCGRTLRRALQPRRQCGWEVSLPCALEPDNDAGTHSNRCDNWTTQNELKDTMMSTKTQTIVITCTECGGEYEPSREDIRAGLWRICHRCRSREGSK